MDIKVLRIVPNPNQPRNFFDEDEQMALVDSLQQHGLLNPIAVAGPVADGLYLLIDGERRWRAAQTMGWETIPAQVRAPSTSELEMLLLAVVGNVQRAAMGPVDEARAYAKLRLTFSAEEIAEKVGKHPTSIYQLLKLLDGRLTLETLEQLNRRTLPLDYTMLRQLAELDAEQQHLVVTRAVRCDLSGAQIRGVIGRLGRASRHNFQTARRQAQLANGLPPAQILADVPTLNGLGPAVATTCEQCGMAEDGNLVVCKECPLVKFIRLYEKQN